MEKQQLSFIAIVLISIILTTSFVIYQLDSMKSNEPSPTPSPFLWQSQIEHPATYLAADDEKVFITDDTSIVLCFDRQTGESLWNASIRVRANRRLHQIVIIENRVYVAYENARVSCFDKNNGTLLWTIQNAPESYYDGRPTITFEDDLMYVITDGISARDAITGKLIWEVNPFLKRFDDSQTRVHLLGGDCVDGEFVYAVGEDFSNKILFYKINIKNGNIVWQNHFTWNNAIQTLTVDWIPGVAANVQGRIIIPVTFQGDPYVNKLICLDSASGEELWSIDIGAGGYDRFVFGPRVHNDLFLFAKADGYLYAVNLTNGAIAWKTKVDTNNLFSYNSDVQTSSIQIDAQNQRLFWYLNAAESGPSNNYTGTLCNLDLSNGNVNWIKHLENENAGFGNFMWYTVSLAFNNETDKVFLTKNTGLWIFDASTGDLVQSQQFEHYVLPPVFQGSETFVAADLLVFAIPDQ